MHLPEANCRCCSWQPRPADGAASPLGTCRIARCLGLRLRCAVLRLLRCGVLWLLRQLAHKGQQRGVAEQVLIPRLDHAQPLPPAGAEGERAGRLQGAVFAIHLSCNSRRAWHTELGTLVCLLHSPTSQHGSPPEVRHQRRQIHSSCVGCRLNSATKPHPDIFRKPQNSSQSHLRCATSAARSTAAAPAAASCAPSRPSRRRVTMSSTQNTPERPMPAAGQGQGAGCGADELLPLGQYRTGVAGCGSTIEAGALHMHRRQGQGALQQEATSRRAAQPAAQPPLAAAQPCPAPPPHLSSAPARGRRGARPPAAPHTTAAAAAARTAHHGLARQSSGSA